MNIYIYIYQEDGKTGVCDGESQIFIPFWIYVFVDNTSLQFLQQQKKTIKLNICTWIFVIL